MHFKNFRGLLGSIPLFMALLAGISTSALGSAQSIYEARAQKLDKPWTLQSGVERNALLELYTSQNCPACPPAEAWLTNIAEMGLKPSPMGDQVGLWKTLIPISWHVTFMDSPGRTDPLGSRDADQRLSYASEMIGRGPQVATPTFIVNGQLWDTWHQGQPPQISTPPVGVMTLRHAQAGEGYEVEYTPPPGSKMAQEAGGSEFTALVALQVSNLYLDPRRGPDAVMPRLTDFAMVDLKKSALKFQDGKWIGQLPSLSLEEARKQHPDARFSIAAWVSVDPYGLIPIQSVGSWVK